MQDSIKLEPAATQALIALATLRAAAPDAKFRDGKEAVRLARKACQSTEDKSPEALDALAAALAETAQFDEAIQVAQQALQLARSASKANLIRQIEVRLTFYRRTERLPLRP
jgi:tetratricopeptide (TPR) repeat protein